MMAGEKKLDNKVLKLLSGIGAWSIKYWAGSVYTKSGIPDILACVSGVFFGIEDKDDDGRPSMLQLVNLKKIRAAGGIGILLYPDDFENFERFVRDFDGKKLSKAQKEWYNENIKKQKRWEDKLG